MMDGEPFEPGKYGNDEGQEFVSPYLFDPDGRFFEARVGRRGEIAECRHKHSVATGREPR
jgi:hypothetical protein